MGGSGLGKLLAVHGVAPVYTQRAALVAALSFIFFFAMLAAFYVRGQFLYFLLSTAFLIVLVFTIIGWLMRRRDIIEIYENGLKFGSKLLLWKDIESISAATIDSVLVLKTSNGGQVELPKTIYQLDSIRDFIVLRLSEQKSPRPWA